MKVDEEYQRIKNLFKDCDEGMLDLIDGTIWEAARCRVELEQLHEVIRMSGPIKFNPKNPVQQKEVPAMKLLIKQRANYLNYISKLSGILGKVVLEEEDDLSEFE